MSGINFLSENLTDNAVYTVTTGAENAQFPIANLKSDFTTKKFRSTGNTVVFEVDWQQFRNIDFLALTGDATATLGVTAMSVKLSITTDFSSSLVYNLDINAENNIGFVALTSVSARYAEVTVTGTGSYSEIGKLFIGSKVNLPQNSLSISSFKFGRKDRSSIRSNQFGQKFIDIRNNTESVSGTIQYMTVDELDIVDQLFIDHGKNKPLWVIIDESGVAFTDSEYKLTMYVYMSKDPSYSASGGKHYNVGLNMETVV